MFVCVLRNFYFCYRSVQFFMFHLKELLKFFFWFDKNNIVCNLPCANGWCEQLGSITIIWYFLCCFPLSLFFGFIWYYFLDLFSYIVASIWIFFFDSADWRCKWCDIFFLGCLSVHALSVIAKQPHFQCWCQLQTNYQPMDSASPVKYPQVSNCINDLTARMI